MRRGAGWAVALWFGLGAGAVFSGWEPGPGEPGERVPTLRKIDWQEDAEARERIHYYRRRLPAELRRQNNFAWARADIPGLR